MANFNEVDRRLIAIEAKLDALIEYLDDHDQKIKEMEQKSNQLEYKLIGDQK